LQGKLTVLAAEDRHRRKGHANTPFSALDQIKVREGFHATDLIKARKC